MAQREDDDQDISRVRLSRTVKRTAGGVAVGGGLSLAGILAFAVPWAQGQTEQLNRLREAQSLAATTQRIEIAEIRGAISGATATAKIVEANGVRLSALEQRAAADGASQRELRDRLDRIERKLDDLRDRK